MNQETIAAIAALVSDAVRYGRDLLRGRATVSSEEKTRRTTEEILSIVRTASERPASRS